MADVHVTEAACLVEQGASYRRRVGFKPVVSPGDPIFAGFKQGAFSLYFGDAPIYHFDLEGRWQRAFVDGTHFLKGLDAAVHAIERVREGPNLVLKCRLLAADQVEDLDERICSTVLELMDKLASDTLGRVEPPSPRATPLATTELQDFLSRIGLWDAAAWRDHRDRYARVYQSREYFLPPECQNAVVLDAASGCMTADEFARHTQDVAELWVAGSCKAASSSWRDATCSLNL